MLSDVCQVGDKCTVEIPKENREWGYNPCEDGTEVEVLGFNEIHYGRISNFGKEPGIYVNKSWVNVTNGKKTWTEHTFRLTMLDEAEYERRRAEYFKDRKKYQAERLRDLPETEFWEMDKVLCPRAQEGWTVEGNPVNWMSVSHINYQYIGQYCNDGVTPMPLYSVSPEGKMGGYTSVRAEDLTLIERGNVWKYYHNEPLVFENLHEEAQFFELLGHTKEVRNPANDLYKWTKDEVLDAISEGIAHGFYASQRFFGPGVSIGAIKFNDEELGQRVAKATLEGFNVNS